MRSDEHAGVGRRTGRRPGFGVVAALAAATTVTGVAFTGPAAATAVTAATDDGEDLSDLLVDEVDGYDLQPRGDPTQGRSGPIDWEEMGSVPGLGTDDLPSDMATYVKTFVADDYGTFALVMGLDIGDFDPAAALAGAAMGMGQHGDDELSLPDADRAEVEYEARRMPGPAGAPDLTSAAAVLADEDIVVMVLVSSHDGEPTEQHRVLDRFVTAQAQFEPPPDRPRSGGFGDEGDEDDDGAAAGDDEVAGATQPAGGGGGSGARQAGLVVSGLLLTVGLALLVRYLVVDRLRPAAAGPRPLGGPSAGGPPLAPAAPPRPAPPPTAAPPAGPRQATAPPATAPPGMATPTAAGGAYPARPAPGAPPEGSPDARGEGNSDGGGWQLPG